VDGSLVRLAVLSRAVVEGQPLRGSVGHVELRAPYGTVICLLLLLIPSWKASQAASANADAGVGVSVDWVPSCICRNVMAYIQVGVLQFTTDSSIAHEDDNGDEFRIPMPQMLGESCQAGTRIRYCDSSIRRHKYKYFGIQARQSSQAAAGQHGLRVFPRMRTTNTCRTNCAGSEESDTETTTYRHRYAPGRPSGPQMRSRPRSRPL
jgi:hypothetical protein